jgi:hypothetical protein
MMNFVPNPLLGVEWLARPQSMPTPTIQQAEALSVVQAIAAKYQCVLDMKPGDLTFINNFGVLHAREGFEDSGTQSRYLVRMWLKNERLAWSLPPELAEGNERLFNNSKIEKTWNLVPEDRQSFEEFEIMTP